MILPLTKFSFFVLTQALGEAAGDAIEARGGAAAATTKGLGVDIGLILYFLFWYVGNYYVRTMSKKNSPEVAL